MDQMPLFVEPCRAKIFVPRQYQLDALDRLIASLMKHPASLCVAAMGLGKSALMAMLADHWYAKTGLKTMGFVHTGELAHQNSRAVEAITGEWPELEKAESYAEGNTKFVVATTQTSSRGIDNGRNDRIPVKDFGLALFDEGHRAINISNRRLQGWLREGNPEIKFAGFTGTPVRSDGVSLGNVFQDCPVNLSFQWGVENGWLCRPMCLTRYLTHIGISGCGTGAGGDFIMDELAASLKNKETVLAMAMAIKQEVTTEKTLVFCAGVDQAELMTKALRKYGFSAELLTGKTDLFERKMILRRFRSGETQILVNVEVLVEGLDVADIGAVVLCRPTKSLRLLSQIIGRGARPLPGVVDGHASITERLVAIAASAKPNFRFLDFTGDVGGHRLASAADVFAGDRDPVELLDVVAKKITDGDGPQDVLKLLRGSRAEEIASKKAEKELKDKVHDGILNNAVVTIETEDREFDIFDFWDIPVPKKRRVQWQKPPTQKMLDHIMSSTGFDASGISLGDAGKIIQKISKSASAKQINVLLKAGYSKEELKPLGRGDISSLITITKANGWHKPGIQYGNVA